MAEDKKKIRKKLQGEKCFNPFNKDFDWQVLKKYLDSESPVSSDDEYAMQIAKSSEYYYDYYNQYMAYIKNAIQEAKGNINDIIQVFFGMENLDVCRMSRMMAENDGISSLMDAAYFGVDSPVEHFGEMNVVGAVEGQVDYANILINVLRHMSLSTSAEVQSIQDRIKVVHKMYAATNLLYYLKESYDTALWENGFIEKSEDKLKVKYLDKEYPIVRHIGNIRSNNNIAGAMESVRVLSSRVEKFREEYFGKGRTSQIIESSWLDTQGYIQYSLIKKENCFDYDSAYALARTELDLYYPYIPNKKFEKIKELSINDLIIMFSRLSNLISQIKETILLNDKNEKNLLSLPVKMTKRELICFFKHTTNYKKDQISTFLELNTSRLDNEKRINLWTRPLLLLDNTYYFLFAAVSAPSYSFLVDEWLNSMGFDLGERGKIFEKYIKDTIKGLLDKKKYMYCITDKNKLYNKSNEFEEIDLLINLKSLVVIGEIKCIKYPMECRDTFNNLKILKKAAKQIKRKSNFVEKYKDDFAKDIGQIENKEILKVIITNYPIFAGSKVDDIPVIDFYLFDSYIRSGKLTQAVVIPSNKNGDRFVEYKEKPYYKNEDEFSKKMNDFILNPPSIESLRKELTVEEKELTLPTASIHIFQDFVVKDKS